MSPIGAYISIHTPRKMLLWVFVAFLSYTLYNLIKGKAKEEAGKFSGNAKGYLLGILVGAIAGFLGGLLGVGSGSIILAALALIETDYKKVPATAAYITLLSYASGFISYLLFLRRISYVLWLVVFIGGVLGGFAGSYLTKMNKVRTTLVKYTIITIIAFVLIKILVGLI
jgi:uncharacterized membrane protein YfcA